MDSARRIDNLYFALSGVFAVVLYFLLILFILFILSAPNPIQISLSNPSAMSSISVNLVEIPAQKETIEAKAEKSSTIEAKNRKDSGSKSAVAGFDAGELFSKIETNNKKSETKPSDGRDSIARNKKEGGEKSESSANLNKILGETKNIMNSLSAFSQNIVIADSNSTRFCEQYRDYCNELSELLYKGWNTSTSFDYTLSSVVLIQIDKDGNFRYTIKKKSGNANFDSELETSLSNLKGEKFPIIENVNIKNLEVIFRNKKGEM